MSGNQLNDLLTRWFSEEDSRLLQYFFQNHADAEYFTYADVRLSQEETQDLLMLGLEQRVLLPEKTRINLHDMLDLLVISDVMSPCPARSLNTGWRGMKSTLCVTGGSHQCNKT